MDYLMLRLIEIYGRVFGEPSEDPRALVVSIGSNATRSSAEVFVGSLVFSGSWSG